MMMVPQVSWLFFKARAKRRYLDSYGSSKQRGKTANGVDVALQTPTRRHTDTPIRFPQVGG